MNKDGPFVSVIIPIRNEEKYLAQCLQSVIAQDYPKDRMEILVVDGKSEDRSREIVAEFGSKYPMIKLLDNPRLIVSTAMNIGIKNAKGDVIIRVDGHCLLESDYISQCVKCLRRTGADNVGGLMQAVGQGYVGEVIALALNSFFGSGGSKFHYASKEQYVDTVYLGAFPRHVFDKVGLFNEKLVRNQDYELNYRIRAAGGKIFLSPAIKSYYYGRSSLRDLWHQYFQYGFWSAWNNFFFSKQRFSYITWMHTLNIFSHIYFFNKFNIQIQHNISLSSHFAFAPERMRREDQCYKFGD